MAPQQKLPEEVSQAMVAYGEAFAGVELERREGFGGCDPDDLAHMESELRAAILAYGAKCRDEAVEWCANQLEGWDTRSAINYAYNLRQVWRDCGIDNNDDESDGA